MSETSATAPQMEMAARSILWDELLYVPGLDEEVVEFDIPDCELRMARPGGSGVFMSVRHLVFKRTATPSILGFYEYDLLGERTA